jgi:4-amino-4-deoxy-L-arabinose transferase-like glycosyltransferase
MTNQPTDPLPDRLSALAPRATTGPLPPLLSSRLARRRWSRRLTRAGTVAAGLALVVLAAFMLRSTPVAAPPSPPGPPTIAASTPPPGCIPTLASTRAAVQTGDLDRILDCPGTLGVGIRPRPAGPRSILADL